MIWSHLKQVLRYAFWLGGSVFGFVFGVLFCVPFLLGLRRLFPRPAYWIGTWAMFVLLFTKIGSLAGIGYALMTILAALYMDAEESGASIFAAGAFSVGVTFAFSCLSLALWTVKSKVNVAQYVTNAAQNFSNQIHQYNPQIEIPAKALASQAPSALVLLLIFGLFIGLIWDRNVLSKLLGRPAAIGTNWRLSSFRVPNFILWISLLVALGAFGPPLKISHVKEVSLNLFNILFVLYLLQGVAILRCFFRMRKFSSFWQTLALLFLVLQLSPLVAIYGFSDFWLNYRERWAKKSLLEV